MINEQYLVSIGIPTYNRVDFLRRSIESALNQDYRNIEVLVSDNASNDETEKLCQYFSIKDSRFKYIRSAVNRGSTENFINVLNAASGQFFMWLGDDDWIDSSYVSTCIECLINEPDTSLISGKAEYYRNGQKEYDGRIFNLSSNVWWLRIISYYWRVADNGMFYGLMRTGQIKQLELLNTMGGDWLLIAGVAFFGKVKMTSNVTVHRELGGATVSYRKIVDTLNLPKIQGIFPMISIAYSACREIVKTGVIYKSKSIYERLFIGCLIFLALLVKEALNYASKLRSLIKKCC